MNDKVWQAMIDARDVEISRLMTERDRLRAALEWVEQNSSELDIAGYAGRALEGK
jgi:hypothetical protein